MMLYVIVFCLFGISTCQQLAEVMRMMNKLNEDLVEKCDEVSSLENKVRTMEVLKQRMETVSNQKDETTVNIQVMGMQRDLQHITSKTLPEMQEDLAEITNEDIPNLKTELEQEMKDAEGTVRSVEAQLDAITASMRKTVKEQNDLTKKLDALEEQLTGLKVEDITTRRPFQPNKVKEVTTRRPLQPSVAPTANPNGNFILRITNYFQQKRANRYIFGPEFKLYKGQYAYSLRMVVKLGGDTENQKGYISVFIQVMQGPDDDYLPWPIKGYLTVALLPQDGVSDPIALDQITFSDNGAYRKPGTDAAYSEAFAPHNQPWGYPIGFRHEDVENSAYLVDDAILISYQVSERRFA